jgi:hypothetical protein
MNQKLIPGPDAIFDGWQSTLMSNVASRAPRLNIPSDTVADVQTLQTRWRTAYAAAEDPATRTKGAVKEKQEARTAYEAGLRALIRSYLTYNPLLSDKDREDMGLPVHKTTHTHAPIAADPPDIELDTSVPGRVSFHYYGKGSASRRAKPEGQHGMELIWSLGDPAPARWEDLAHSSFDTHTPLTLSFENDQRGQTLYFALRWENTRGEKGPWSNIQSTKVP